MSINVSIFIINDASKPAIRPMIIVVSKPMIWLPLIYFFEPSIASRNPTRQLELRPRCFRFFTVEFVRLPRFGFPPICHFHRWHMVNCCVLFLVSAQVLSKKLSMIIHTFLTSALNSISGSSFWKLILLPFTGQSQSWLFRNQSTNFWFSRMCQYNKCSFSGCHRGQPLQRNFIWLWIN
jgi:hypothetical protein